MSCTDASPLARSRRTSTMSPSSHALNIGASCGTMFNVRKLTSQPDAARFIARSQILPVSQLPKLIEMSFDLTLVFSLRCTSAAVPCSRSFPMSASTTTTSELPDWDVGSH